MTNQEHDLEALNRMNFRSSLEALARPGELQQITPLFNSGLLALASVLLYAEVSYYYRGTLDFKMIQAICGTTPAPAAEADYIFTDRPDINQLQTAGTGTPEHPESGATLIAYDPSPRETGVKCTLSGPGIDGRKAVTLPVSSEFIHLLNNKNQSFPMGVELFFINQNNELLGLPRTTKIEVQ